MVLKYSNESLKVAPFPIYGSFDVLRQYVTKVDAEIPNSGEASNRRNAHMQDLNNDVKREYTYDNANRQWEICADVHDRAAGNGERNRGGNSGEPECSRQPSLYTLSPLLLI